MPAHSIPVSRYARGNSNAALLLGTLIPRASAGRRHSRPMPRQVAAATDAETFAEVLQSDRFKEALRPLRAECEPAQEGAGVKVTVVSKAFEGKSAKRREKLVLQALQKEEPEDITIMAMTPGESAAMLKKWC